MTFEPNLLKAEIFSDTQIPKEIKTTPLLVLVVVVIGFESRRRKQVFDLYLLLLCLVWNIARRRCVVGHYQTAVRCQI